MLTGLIYFIGIPLGRLIGPARGPDGPQLRAHSEVIKSFCDRMSHNRDDLTKI